MSLERKCENCANNETSSCDNCYNFFYFAPREELVRQDERNKIIGQVIGLLKSDLESGDFSTTSVQDYIKGTIELLEEEQKCD